MHIVIPQPRPYDTDYGEVESLFVRMAAAGSDEERARCRCDIITMCVPLADQLAYRFVGHGQPHEDLVQVARLGLVKAVDRYQPEKGRFLSFTVPTILGELRRYFRDNTWAMRVPRNLKETRQRVRSAIDPLSQRLGRMPTVSELAAELDVACEEVVFSLDSNDAYQPLSLDAAIAGSDLSRVGSSLLGAEDPGYTSVEDVLSVAVLLDDLPARQRDIVRMRFEECLTQSEIAERIGVSQVHVSRLLTHALQELRRRYWADVPARTLRRRSA